MCTKADRYVEIEYAEFNILGNSSNLMLRKSLVQNKKIVLLGVLYYSPVFPDKYSFMSAFINHQLITS